MNVSTFGKQKVQARIRYELQGAIFAMAQINALNDLLYEFRFGVPAMVPRVDVIVVVENGLIVNHQVGAIKQLGHVRCWIKVVLSQCGAIDQLMQVTWLEVSAMVLSNTGPVQLLMSRSHPKQALVRRVTAALVSQPPCLALSAVRGALKQAWRWGQCAQRVHRNADCSVVGFPFVRERQRTRRALLISPQWSNLSNIRVNTPHERLARSVG